MRVNTDVSPGEVQSSRQAERTSFPADFSQSPKENQMTLTAVMDSALCEHGQPSESSKSSGPSLECF